MWKLFHIEQQIEANAQEIKKKNKALAGLRREQAVHDKDLEEARAEQAKSRATVATAEKKVKKAEKALENRVRLLLMNALSISNTTLTLKRPDLVAAEQKIQHAQRKLKNHEATRELASKDAKKQEERLASLRKDLQAEQKAAEAARGS